eukprot:5637300-Pyramimonas_sp.AAC.1
MAVGEGADMLTRPARTEEQTRSSDLSRYVVPFAAPHRDAVAPTRGVARALAIVGARTARMREQGGEECGKKAPAHAPARTRASALEDGTRRSRGKTNGRL